MDIDAGNALVDRIRPAVRSTHREGVLGGIGGFGALFELPLHRYRNPVLVSGTDGVGTKLRLATLLGRHDTIGIDLVAMCVNDIVVAGAEPLYFLDYFATGHLDVDQAATVIEGIAEGCRQAGCALAGGETAEMPGMYSEGDYDLAGFAVGIVERDRLPDPARVRPGQVLIGIASSGPHSNGYSLVRRVLERSGEDPATSLGDSTLGEALLSPTRIYVGAMLKLMQVVRVSGAAHITGGGITENLPRVLPDGVVAEIDLAAWTLPPVFQWLQDRGGIEATEMLRTFNCGVGMLVAVDADDSDAALACLRDAGENAFTVGRLAAATGKPRVTYQNPW